MQILNIETAPWAGGPISVDISMGIAFLSGYMYADCPTERVVEKKMEAGGVSGRNDQKHVLLISFASQNLFPPKKYLMSFAKYLFEVVILTKI